MAKVSIYTTPTCTYCIMAKQWFKENNIEFEEFDVNEDEIKRNELVEKTGQMGVPVIEVEKENGEKETVVGFDKERLTEILEVK